MDSMDNVRERFEALKQRTKQGHQPTHALEAHTRMAARRLRWWRGIACGLVMLGLLSWALPFGAAQDLLQQPSQTLRALEPSRHVTRQVTYGQLPLSFEANQGQTNDQVQFLAHGQGYTLFLTAREAVFAFRPPAASGSHLKRIVPRPKAVQDTPDTARTVVHMQLLGANPAPQSVGLEELPGKANYFRGNDPQQWRTHVPTYAKVQYAAVYPGIDLVYYGQSRQLEYDFVVAPGADPTVITLGFEGINHVDIDAQGDLVLSTASESLRFQKPVVYQEEGGRRQAIAGIYVHKGPHQVGFQLAAYDVARPLVIDPVLSYSTYLGGSGIENSGGIAIDAAGHAYVTGITSSSDFPTAHALQPALDGIADAFVAKLTADGAALVYSTYLGGSDFDQGRGIAVDATGAAYVTGKTTSADFPTVHPLQPTLNGFGDAFVAKLTADGAALVYSTYLGGSGDENSNNGGGLIAVDATGAAYVTGETTSSDFPTVHPLQPTFGDGVVDAFVAKLTADGAALVYSTYLGGSGDDRGTGIAVDTAGAAYVTGSTCSSDFPTVHPLQPTLGGGDACSQGGTPGGDAFVAKLTADGAALIYATYLGGSGNENGGGGGITVDATGTAYVVGTTESSDFPTTRRAFQVTSSSGGGFVAKLTADGRALVYATYLGGAGGGIAVDAAGHAYVTGGTTSPDFPTVHPIQPTLGGGGDSIVTKFTADGAALVYSTYLGGCGGDGGGGIAVDATGAAYVVGTTQSPDFPTTPGAFQTMLGGGGICGQRPHSQNAFVAKLTTLAFAGTPGRPNCHGASVSALVRQFGGLDTAASALGFASVQALEDAIQEFCEE